MRKLDGGQIDDPGEGVPSREGPRVRGLTAGGPVGETDVGHSVRPFQDKNAGCWSMLEAPRTAKTDGACPPFLTIPEPADAFQSKHDRSFLDLGGYLLEDYPRLLDAERPDHDRRDHRPRNQQPQEPTQMVRAPRIEWAEQRHPAPSAEMP